MDVLNVEIKARCHNPDSMRGLLHDQGATFIGRDNQTDVYYSTAYGRLKLRTGNIENALIYYNRPDTDEPKQSAVKLYKTQAGSELADVLEEALEVLVTVRKTRDIFFIDNVKFHEDEVEGLGAFVEIEAIDNDRTRDADELREQCEHFIALLGIVRKDLVSQSYSDLLMEIA